MSFRVSTALLMCTFLGSCANQGPDRTAPAMPTPEAMRSLEQSRYRLPPGSTIGVKGMTVAELDSCARSAKDLLSTFERLRLDYAKLKMDGPALSEAEKKIQADRATVNPRSQEQVDRFNTRITAMHSNIFRFNQRVDAYNGSARASTIQRNQFNTSCAKRHYLVADKERLSIEHQKALDEFSEQSELPVY